MGSILRSELSKEPFGCCGSWHICEMGMKKCIHVDEDPKYASLCSCYKRYKQRFLEKNHQVQVKFNSEDQGYLF